MKAIQITIGGIAPLMMHNDQLANPMNEYTRRIKEYTGKRVKTDEDYEAIRQLEFLGGIYYSELTGVHIPGRNIRKCFVDGAMTIKKGPAVKRGVIIPAAEVPLVYVGPKKPQELYRAESFVDTRTAGNNGARIVRTRPIFKPPWSLTISMMVDPSQINDADLRQCIERAGTLCGLGDYRLGRSGGSYGTFRIERWED